MSRVRSAFLGIFAAEVAACVFAVSYCLDAYRVGFIDGWFEIADAFRSVFRQQLEPLQPVLFILGAVGGVLAVRTARFRTAVVVIAAAASATIAHELVKLGGGTAESLREFAGDAPLFLGPAVVAAVIALGSIRPEAAGPTERLSPWVNRVFAAAGAILLWVGGGMAWWLWALVLMAPVALGLEWRWRRYAFLLTPLTIPVNAFASGVLGYVTGTGVFMSYGLAREDHFNIDRRTRAPYWNGGCLVQGTEVATMVPSNVALDMMGALFGRMPFSYDGPYPDRDEAFAALDGSGRELDVDFEHGRLSDAGEALQLPREIIWRLPGGARCENEHRPLLATRPVPRLLIVGDAAGVKGRQVWLVDLDRHEVFATYFDHR